MIGVMLRVVRVIGGAIYNDFRGNDLDLETGTTLHLEDGATALSID